MEIARALPLAADHGPVVPGWGESPAADAGPDAPPPEPGGRIDNACANAGAQVVGRPPPSIAEPTDTDDALPALPSTDSELVAPAALLVPRELVGLQSERAEAWSLAWRGFDPQALRIERDDIEAGDDASGRPPRDGAGGDPAPDAEADDGPADAGDEDTLLEAWPTGDGANAASDAWAAALSHALEACLGAQTPPPPLSTAAEQWRRGRCVALACPRDAVAGSAGWAFVLWPRLRPSARPASGRLPLALRGLRVSSTLQWFAPQGGDGWRQAKLLKAHHPRAGRQLVAPGERGAGCGASLGTHVPCELQLGPVLPPWPRACDVRVRVAESRRFWAALGSQWSLHLIVCTWPLLAAAGDVEEVAR